MSRDTARSKPRRRWEHRLLAILAYPANLAFAGVAAFVLTVPIVTWLSAWIAAGRALHGWLVDEEDQVFTQTFREFAQTWRRTLPASMLATAVAGVLATNVLFLGQQDSPVAFVLGMATIPVASALALIALMLPAAAASDHDGTMRGWSRAAARAAAARPLGSLVLLAIVAAFGLTCVVLPTIVPFFGASLPVWLGLVTARSATHTGSERRS